MVSTLASQQLILYQNKKIVGSAQKRFSQQNSQEIVLQHGSILLGPEHCKLVDFLSEKDEKILNEIKYILKEKTIDIKTVLGRDVDYNEAVHYLKEGFEREWQINFLYRDNFHDYAEVIGFN